MLIPPYNAVLRALGTTPQELENQSEITVPSKLLKFLLKIAVVSGDFNENGYLAANPDVATAVRQKMIPSARDHYVTTGYWECRRGATPDVDENWYRKSNPDVAAAIRNKTVTSVSEHYLLTGVEEFRSPNEASNDDCLTWKSLALRKPVRAKASIS